MTIAITPAAVVDRALRDAGIPIDGVSIGTVTDRATWKALYAASATTNQRTQGDALIAVLDLQDAVTLANLRADAATALADQDIAKAIAQALYECIPAPTRTPAQLRARILQLLST